jgi:hypothetical protein
MSEGLNPAALAVAAASGAPGATAGPSAPAAEILPPFTTNLVPAVSLSRSIIIMVDDESMPIGEEQRLRATLTRFVRSLPATDQVSLVTVPRGRVEVPFTTDRERLAKSIGELQPFSPIDDPSCRSRTMLNALQTTMTRALAQRAPDQPLVVAFLSAALSGISTQEQAQRPTASGGGGVSAQAGACAIRSDDFVAVGNAQAAARAQFYVIHPDYSSSTAAKGGIEDLRSHTGAPLLHLTSSGEPGLTRMARETAGYYLATFDSEPDELVGKPHQSQVRTTRKDVEIRARPFLIVGKDTPVTASRPDAPLGAMTTSIDMVRSGRAFRDLELRGTSWPTRDSNVKTAVNVIAMFEPVDPTIKVMQASAALIDDNGTAWAYWPPAEMAKQPLTTWPTVIGLTVNPGKYRLRVAVIDDKGRTGLIEETIVAELKPAGPLQLGGLSLGVSRQSGFVPRVLFTTEASAIAMFDLYGGVSGETKIACVFEVARTTDGPSMFNVNATASPTGEDGKFVVTGTIPVGALKPGDYVIRAVVTVEGQGSGRVIRTLRKS